MSNPTRLEGTRVASTRDIVILNEKALAAGFERTLKMDEVLQLDPGGWHIICARASLLEESREEADDLVSGQTATQFSIGKRDALPCEILLKRKNVDPKDPLHRFLDIALMDFMELEVPKGAAMTGFLWRT